jgi:hypothetical protein
MAMVVARGGAKKSTTPLCPRQACHPRWAAPAPRTVLRACCTVRGYRHLQLARNGGNGLRRRRLCWRPPAGTAAAAAAAATAALGSAFFAPSSALWLTGRALARCEEKKEDCGEGTRCASESAEKVEPPAPGSEDEARMVAEIPEAHLLEYIASVERPLATARRCVEGKAPLHDPPASRVRGIYMCAAHGATSTTTSCQHTVDDALRSHASITRIYCTTVCVVARGTLQSWRSCCAQVLPSKAKTANTVEPL